MPLFHSGWLHSDTLQGQQLQLHTISTSGSGTGTVADRQDSQLAVALGGVSRWGGGGGGGKGGGGGGAKPRIRVESELIFSGGRIHQPAA